MFGYRNYEQFKLAVETIVKGLLARSRNVIIKHITVEQIGIPEKSTSDLESTGTQGKYVMFYNTTREQFEIWEDGTYKRTVV